MRRRDVKDFSSKVSGNQFPHDFRGAAINPQHARVGIEAADFIFAHESVAAEKLQALIDEARKRLAQKRDGGDQITLSDTNLGERAQVHDVLDVDDLLSELERFDALAAKIVELRVFGGLSIEEVAESVSVSIATVNRRWAAGKAWLTRELSR